MEKQTIIHSNGSKWAGQEPDSIEKLLEVLKVETIEERFFSQWLDRNERPENKRNFCPVEKLENGNTLFFGNFERLSHVFRIETNDPKIVDKLTEAIKNNEGWKKYYLKNLH